MGHPADQPLRFRKELTRRDPATGLYPILRERTPVRMDLTHCGWSDIFFLGMDYPEGAKVLNISVDLAVHGRDKEPAPPVEASLRVIEEPVLRLTSVDLGCSAEISSLNEVFDFAKDYLGLLKAAVIASGIVPPGIEGSGQSLADLLARVVGPGRGLELVSNVNNIPKGSRLAVSTNLLAALIGVCMRATGQARSLTGGLEENERRIVLARALLGEWIGGSGGGWQDSGGVWPGMKLICGAIAGETDPEFGVSRGRLMPTHRILDDTDVPPESRKKLQDSLVLVHGGMAQNVGPILEMVTEKYLLRSEPEWTRARANPRHSRPHPRRPETRRRPGHRQRPPRRISTDRSRRSSPGPATSTPRRSSKKSARISAMISGASGCLAAWPAAAWASSSRRSARPRASSGCRKLMSETKRTLAAALPFAMEPVVYDFAINERGTWADLLDGGNALMPSGYYRSTVPALLRMDRAATRRAAPGRARSIRRRLPDPAGTPGHGQTLFDSIFPHSADDCRQPRNAARPAREIRLRPRDPRADPRGPQGRPHRPRPKPAARQRRHRRRARIRPNRCPTALHRTPATRTRRPARTARSPSSRSPPAPDRAGPRARASSRPCIPSANSAAATAPSSKPTSRRAARPPALCGTPLPHIFTTSYFSHEPTRRFLERARQLRLRRTARSIRGKIHRPAHRSHRARPALRLGGNAAADARRAAAESPRQPAHRAASAGRKAPARRPTTPTTCRPVPAPRRPLV